MALRPFGLASSVACFRTLFLGEAGEADLLPPGVTDLDLSEPDSETPLKKFGLGGLPYFAMCHLTYWSRRLS